MTRRKVKVRPRVDNVMIGGAVGTPIARYFDVFRNPVCALQRVFKRNVVTMMSIKTNVV